MRNATLKDVAAAAGVGVSTASYVLSGSGLNKVGAETQKRIREAAEKLHYRPNSVARELKSGQCRLIALLLPGVNYSFMPDLLQSIEDVLCDHHYNALLSTYRTPEEFAECCRLISQQRIAGGIAHPGGEMELLPVLEKYFPITPWMVCASMTDERYPAVWVSGSEVGQIGLEYLLERNHRKIGCCLSDSLRWNKLDAVCRKYDLNVEDTISWLNADPHDPEALWNELAYIKANKPEQYPSALFLHGDIETAAFMSFARSKGLSVPEDISLLSVNGSELCNYTNPRLTSVIQPRLEQGKLAAERLLEWIKSGIKPDTLTLPASILEGESVKTLPKL